MFLHLSVSHSVHKGSVCLSACCDTHPPPGADTLPADTPWEADPPGSRPPRSKAPRGRHPPWKQTPPQEADTPLGSRHLPRDRPPPPRSRHLSGSRHPPSSEEHIPQEAVHAGRYGQQAGDTHPTGMHTCY